MELVTPPTAGDDCRDNWKPLAKLARIVNALGNARIILSQVRNRLTLSEGSATLELMLGAGGAAGAADVTHPWQPYSSSWQGEGADPLSAENRKRAVRLRVGEIEGRVPGNMIEEFVVEGSLDAAVTEADAVRNWFFLKVPTSETSVGSGDVAVDTPTIYRAKGADAYTAAFTAGIVQSAFTATSFPAYAVVSLCGVWVWGGALHFHDGRYADLGLNVVVSGTACESGGRQFQVTT